MDRKNVEAGNKKNKKIQPQIFALSEKKEKINE